MKTLEIMFLNPPQMNVQNITNSGNVQKEKYVRVRMNERDGKRN